MARGFACVALDQPKDPANIGGVIRAAKAYGAALVVVSGNRFEKRAKTDTTKGFRHIPIIRGDDVLASLPVDCVPVAVDLLPGATPLPEYEHPERAFYIFGGEDRTLGPEVVDRCRDRVFVPTTNCMNLAAAVNVVLYDRMAKAGARKGARHEPTEADQD
jgi:tRNA(Leu) C34 or U34 (ribose-2'-O)-methylase TrmL